MKIEVSRLSSKYIAHVGFVTTPKYFDDAIHEFLKVAPQGVGAIQRAAEQGYRAAGCGRYRGRASARNRPNTSNTAGSPPEPARYRAEV